MVGRHRIPIIPLSDRRYCLRLLLGRRAFSTASDPNKTAAAAATDAVGAREDAYRQLQNLDFMTAAKILFTTPPKKKKFGLDFHLVQLFFACMPSLAVYLVAQYARYEIRRMEAEVELKKQQAEEEEKAKEAELGSIEEGSPDSELSKVMVRLDALEETVKEIVDEKKKIPHDDSKKDREANNNSDPQSKSKAGEPTPDSSKETAGSSSPQANAPPDDCKKDKQ